MPQDHGRSRPPAGVVVGIGDQGPETYGAAVRLGAEEASLRQVPLRLVHGSSPAGAEGLASRSGMEHRQQRGRRLVNGAARDLARTRLGRGLRISTESSPQTGVEVLLAQGRTAVMLVLQRAGGWLLPAGRTISAVTAASGCPTFVTRSAPAPAGDVGVLVVLDPGHDPTPLITLALTEAFLRGTALTVLHRPGDRDDALSAVRAVGEQAHDIPVRWTDVPTARRADQVREVSQGASLMVVVRPAAGEPDSLATAAYDEARCPVLTVDAGVRTPRGGGAGRAWPGPVVDGAPPPAGSRPSP